MRLGFKFYGVDAECDRAVEGEGGEIRRREMNYKLRMLGLGYQAPAFVFYYEGE